MKTTRTLIMTCILSGLLVFIMALSSCSKDEPTPTTEPDAPVLPEHPTKDWQGESAHGFIIDAKILRIPTSERGFICIGNDGSDEIEIDPDAEWDFPLGTSKYSNTANYWHSSYRWFFDGEIADPFENLNEYVTLCLEHKFRWQSRFSNIESLLNLKASKYGEYICIERINSIDIITQKYFDKNHPAGSSMARKEHVGIFLSLSKIDFVELEELGVYFNAEYRPALGVYSDNRPYILWRFTLTMEGFPEQAGEYPMVIKVTMDGGKKTWEQPFTIKFVDKK